MAEIAIFAFAGKAVATSVISNLVSKAFAYFDEYRKSEGMKTTKERLTKTLPRIHSVLSAVDRGQIKDQNPNLDAWLWQLRDAVEEAQDAIDELDYYKLEEKIKARDNPVKSEDKKKVNSTLSKYTKKITKIVKHTPSTSGDTLKRLKKAVEGLDKVAADVGPFLQLVTALGNIGGSGTNQGQGVVTSGSRGTGSLLTESEVFGRDKEKDTIVQWLDKPVDEGSPNVSAFSIVGMGGLGKTTLAQLICKEIRERNVKNNFSIVAWVCVSDNTENFSAEKCMRMILQDLTNTNYDMNLSTLERILKDKVANEKFLLVLDNIWRDNTDKEWEQVLTPLKSGKKGSKIILTTRMESVAHMISRVMEGKKEFLRLGGLEEDDFLNLFNKHAFAGVDPDEHPDLQSIGKQIAKRLGGCPLAAKVLGKLLNRHMDFAYWNNILTNRISNIQEGPNGIMAILRLSYHHLSTDRQLCFRYCSIFPQDYKFEKDMLVKMWVGSGLIQWSKDQGQRPEDIGAEYFDFLASQSFFEVSKDSEHFYVMHDLLHEMAQSVSSGECLRIEGDLSRDFPETVRHVSVKLDGLSNVKKISSFKHLHTLVITLEGGNPESDDVVEFNEFLKKTKSLRLLRLRGDNLFELPGAIGDLIHLRYIFLEQTRTKRELPWFPKSVYKLYHLQLMKLFAFGVRDLSKVEMRGMGNLISLRHLEVHDFAMINIPSIGKLTSLQALKKFNIREEEGYKISELKDLKSLLELHVNNLEKVNDPEEAGEAKLNGKENLNSLSLYWSGDPPNSEQILNSLEPHANLQNLDITGYRGVRFPTWLSNPPLFNLASLKLFFCPKLESLPPLGKLPCLKTLWLVNFLELKRIDHSFYGSGGDRSFPLLKELRIKSMEQLEEWVDIPGKLLFPRLEILGVEGCSQLKALPSLPPTLRRLDVWFSGLRNLPKISNGSSKSSLSFLWILSCTELTSLDGGLLLQLEDLQNLGEVKIEGCGKLVHLSPNGFAGLPSLRKLRLADCPMLVANEIRNNLLPPSLQELWVDNCGLDVSLLSSMRDLPALTRLDLWCCSNIASLPPAEVFVRLGALRDLRILNCKELSSLGGLESLVSLTYFRISGCDKLVSVSQSQPPMETDTDMVGPALQIGELRIGHYSLLLLEPLRRLCSTKKLYISFECEPPFLPEEWLLQNRMSLEEIEIDNARSIQLVPANLVKLECLQKLKLSNASLIQSLPDLPIKLSNLVITGCNPEFKARYEKDKGYDWHKIAHIQSVHIF